MIKEILFIFTSFISVVAASEPWFSFVNKENELIGYKDKNGTIKIEPKFLPFIIAERFDDIISVIEDKNGSYEQYYLLKLGEKVGYNSLYITDNTPDCEREGYIRFEDQTSEKIGMFNSKGEIAIPAEYNSLRPMNNGLIVALKGAKKNYWDRHNRDDCNHFSLEGGTTYLLDKNNNILIKDFNASLELNFFSKKITDTPLLEENRENFLGLNGKYYSFINYEKEFQNWLFSELVYNFSKENFLSATHDRVNTWSKKEDRWIFEDKEVFMSKNFEVISLIFNFLKKKNATYFIGSEHYLNDNFLEFKSYYNSCSEFKIWESPIYSIVVSYKKGFSNRDAFSFLKTKNGYKLVRVTLKTK